MASTELKRAITAADRAERAARRSAQEANDNDRRAALASTTTWETPAPPPRPPLTAKQKRRARMARRLREDEQLLEDTVPEAARANGRYEVALAAGPAIIEDGQERVTTSRVVVNRGGTAIDRWIAGDHTGLQFGLPQQYAIRYCQNLWIRAGAQLRAVDLSEPRVDAPLGWSQNEALDELRHLKGSVPRPFWEVFENVCRFDEEAGTAGSKLAKNRRSAVDVAKTTVAMIAGIIAMRKGFRSPRCYSAGFPTSRLSTSSPPALPPSICGE